MAELPTYVIRPNIVRIVIPEFLLTIFLAGIFYLGIAINVYLIGISIPGSVNLLITITLALLALTQTLLTYIQTARLKYLVYTNRIQIESGKQEYALFSSVQEVQVKKNILDNIFGTGTIIVGSIQMVGIPQVDQTNAYLRQMLQYARSSYQQTINL